MDYFDVANILITTIGISYLICDILLKRFQNDYYLEKYYLWLLVISCTIMSLSIWTYGGLLLMYEPNNFIAVSLLLYIYNIYL